MVPDYPRGRARLAWLGPGFLWMVSAAGSGELLFTPRVGAMHGYALLWAMVIAIAFKRGWLRQMTLDNTVAVAGTFLIAGAFLVLGAELLAPRGLVPEEDRVASTLGRLLGDVWGPVGFWFMVLGVFVGFWDTVLSDQDGHGRMFADGLRLILPPLRRYSDETLRRIIVLVLVTALPIALFAMMGQPVALLKIAGAIEAAHIPVVAFLALYLNRTRLPAGLRPSWASAAGAAIAGLFFAAFAVYYVITLR